MPLLQLLARKSVSVVRMGGLRRRLMVEAFFWLAVARVALLVLPFRKVAAQLGDVLAPAEGAKRMAGIAPPPDAEAIAREIGWSVRRMADYVPFRAVCLQQALAGKAMLRRRGIVGALHLGVATGASPGATMKAHAWLDAAGVKVTGWPFDDEYAEVACFV